MSTVDVNVVDLARGKRMAASIDCAECGENFTGPGMWRAYGRHLAAEHPPAVHVPKRAPVTPAEEVAPMDTSTQTCAVPGCPTPAGHKGWHTGPNGTAAAKHQGGGGAGRAV